MAGGWGQAWAMFSLQEKPVATSLRGVGTTGLEFGDKLLRFPSYPAQVNEHWVMWGALGTTLLVSGGVQRKGLGWEERRASFSFHLPLSSQPLRFSQLAFNTPSTVRNNRSPAVHSRVPEAVLWA